MTNLLAIITVCVVTNIVEADNSSGCAICSANPGIIPAVHHFNGWTPCAPYIAATEKTKTTTVKEISTLKFTWRGKEYTAQDVKVLSKEVQRWKKNESWEAVE